MSSPGTILTETDGNVLVVTLNRPERRNALDPETIRSLSAVLDEADARDDIRAIVVTGAGSSFCVGGDISGGGDTFVRSGDSNAPLPRRDAGGVLSLRLFRSLKPVVGAINGDAVGLGSSMLLPMDARIAVPQARFGFPFVRRGIVPESASTWFLPRLVGIASALDWTLSGRIFAADEAHEHRLIDAIVAPDALLESALARARTLSSHSSGPAVAATRQLLWQGLTLSHPMDAHRAESAAIRHLGAGADAREGITAFLEKRPAEFTAGTHEGVASLLPWWREPSYAKTSAWPQQPAEDQE